MPSVVVEEIPEPLRPQVDAALAWLNRERGSAFRVTGIVDPDRALAQRALEGEAVELGLVLCQDDLCLREQLTVRWVAQGFEVAYASHASTQKPEVPAELDPPAGVRAGWLTEQLAKNGFVLLIFYRGFW